MDSTPTPGSHDISINMGSTDEVVLPLVNQQTPASASAGDIAAAEGQNQHDEYIPRKPTSLKDAGLVPNDLFPLVLKLLFLHGNKTGNQICNQIKIPFQLLTPIMESLKADLLDRPQEFGGCFRLRVRTFPQRCGASAATHQT